MPDDSYADKYVEYFEYPRDEMLAFVPLSAATLLEVGCGGASFAAQLKKRKPLHVTAIESHGPAAVVARGRVDRLLDVSIEDALPELEGQRFDCIVLNDVLEHLVDPWRVLSELRALLSPDGSLVASLPNVRYLPVFKDYVFKSKWEYQQDGVLDRTHLRFFTPHGMGRMFEETGYAVERMQGINPTAVSLKFRLLNAVCGGALTDTRFKQYACVCRDGTSKP